MAGATRAAARGQHVFHLRGLGARRASELSVYGCGPKAGILTLPLMTVRAKATLFLDDEQAQTLARNARLSRVKAAKTGTA